MQADVFTAPADVIEMDPSIATAIFTFFGKNERITS
jgi:hypothetical protein